MREQHGSALIISLLILLVMTIIGISAMSSSTLEEKMAASDRNQKAVFQNAETSLIQAETALAQADYNTEIRPALVSGQKGYYTQDDPKFDYLTPSAWDGNCIEISDNSNLDGNSCYIIEEGAIENIAGEVQNVGPGSNPERGNQFSKITVRSTDNRGMSAVIVQSSLKTTITY